MFYYCIILKLNYFSMFNQSKPICYTGEQGSARQIFMHDPLKHNIYKLIIKHCIAECSHLSRLNGNTNWLTMSSLLGFFQCHSWQLIWYSKMPPLWLGHPSIQTCGKWGYPASNSCVPHKKKCLPFQNMLWEKKKVPMMWHLSIIYYPLWCFNSVWLIILRS